MNEKFYTPKQVAAILQIHQYTVLKWIREGKLKALKLGRVYRTCESDLSIFLGHAAHEVATVGTGIQEVAEEDLVEEQEEVTEEVQIEETSIAPKGTQASSLQSKSTNVPVEAIYRLPVGS